MSDRNLTAEIRSEKRKGAMRRLRRAGRIPAIMYGQREPILLSIDAREFASKFQQISETTIIKLGAGNETYDVLVKDYQANHILDRLEHIDFFEIEQNKLLRARAIVHFVGNPVGVREGGVQKLLIREIEVECLPQDLPERIEVNIENLNVGESLRVSDIVVPDGVRLMPSPDQMVALVSHLVEEEEVVEGDEGDLIDEDSEVTVEEGTEDEA